MSNINAKLKAKSGGLGLSTNDFSNKSKLLVDDIERLNPFDQPVTNGGYYLYNGVYSGSASRCFAVVINDTATKQHYVTFTVGGSAMYGVLFYDANNAIVGRLFQGRDGFNDAFVNQQIVPPNNCTYYIVQGLVNFGGIILRKKQNMFDYLSNILSDFILQTPTFFETDKYYWSNGTIQNNIYRKYAIYNISNTDNLRVNTVIGGSAMPAIIYLNAANQGVGFERVIGDGFTDYVDNFIPSIPVTATKMIVNCFKVNNYSVYKVGTFSKAVSIQQLEVERQRITALENGVSKPMLGKKILLLGTSIPEGGLYPTLGVEKLGGNGINLAVGSSMMRISRADGTTNGLAYANIAYSLMAKITEKQQFINDFLTANLTGKPANLTQAEIDKILSCSFENKVLPYLDGRLPEPDYWAIDHGRNDKVDEPDATMLAMPLDKHDRRTYIGAMNYLIDLILSYNPYAKIFIVGHYENTLFKAVTLAQQSIADRYNIPCLDMWNYTGFSQEKVTGSYVKWNQAPYNLYIPNGQDLNQDMTRLRVFCPDGIHPHSDTSGKTRELLTNIYANQLRTKIAL